MTLVEVRRAEKSWRLRGRRHCALTQVDVDVLEGEILGVVGPNGAGKSTLLLAVAGLLTLDTGSVRMRGRDVPRGSDGTVGYSPERVAYSQTETVSEVLRTFLALRGVPSAPARRLTEHALDSVAMQDDAWKRVGSLSRGMLQRLGLAQALLGSPALVLLDETLSGLDPVVHHGVCQLIAGLPAAGTTVVLSSHDLAAVEELATRVVVMNEGRVCGVLSAAEYARPGSLRRRFLELLNVGSESPLRAMTG
ncbi:MAG TPA: ABC transporter ATP-binding protein [Gemmatimonadaceae bacterium]